MNRLWIILVCVSSIAAGGVSAQEYAIVERRNFWNAGSNVTGLRADSITISYAELYGRGTQGDFRDSYQPSRSWSGGVEARTITHLENYSMIGAFSFDHTSGRGMSGSMFIHPGFYPVDVLEFTPGRKDLQTYSFMGGIAAELAPRWRLGGKFDFAAANIAKRKDLRHTNYRLDLAAAPGVMYHTGQWAVGFAYLFAKNSETIRAEEIGTSAESYYAFLDKGLMYGAYETWSGSGTHLSESGINGFPVREITHGASVQVQWGRLYADAEYRYASGSVGEKQTIWFEFPSHSVSSHIGYRIDTRRASHFMRLRAAWSRQANYENVLGEETSGGVTITRIYGSNRIFEREAFTLNPEYELTAPAGELRIGFERARIDRRTTQMFPFVVSQSMRVNRVYAAGTLHAGRFDLQASGSFSSGSSAEESREAQTSLQPENPPYRLTDYYNMQTEYLTTPRVTLGLGVRAHFGRGLYAGFDAGFTHGFDLRYIVGANRWTETLHLGCTF